MDARAQLVMVFHLDKCIGCPTCSISCKNIWTDRRGAEYMWWNNVETKPGVGYPKKWEDQGTFKGGWVVEGGNLRLRALGKGPTLLNMFFQPNMPKMEDYYEPFDFDYGNLYGAGEGTDQPVAEAFSRISGRKIETIQGGPNWDDDLSGSQLYAAKDVNLEESRIVEEYGTMFMQYLPRICNHCLHPACVAWIRYVGVLLYDAERVEQALLEPDDRLVDAHRAVILDPRDSAVRDGARKNGVSDLWLGGAGK